MASNSVDDDAPGGPEQADESLVGLGDDVGDGVGLPVGRDPDGDAHARTRNPRGRHGRSGYPDGRSRTLAISSSARITAQPWWTRAPGGSSSTAASPARCAPTTSTW